MNFLQVKYVMEIAKYQNVSKAAQALYISQPALSLQVKKLEEELGFSLFIRTSHGVSLSKYGELFCEKGNAVMTAWRDLEDSMNTCSAQHTKSCKLKIWIGARVYANDLFEAIVDFFDQHPEIEVTFLSEMGSVINIFKALDHGGIDVAIDRLPPSYLTDDVNRYFIRNILNEPAQILLRKTHPLAKKQFLNADDLKNYESISFQEGTCMDHIQKSIHEKLGIPYSRKYPCESISESLDLIRSGTCFAIGTKAVAESNHLMTIPLDPQAFIPLEFSCLAERSIEPGIELFYRFITNLCKHPPV